MSVIDTIWNPVDWFNFYGNFISIFEGLKNVKIKNDFEVAFINPENISMEDMNVSTFILKNGRVNVGKENQFGIAVGSVISKFMVLTLIKFNGDSLAAMSHVSFFMMKSKIPYIRVGTDYYKVIEKKDRWGSKHTLLKPWKKDEIKEDHTKAMLRNIFKYDDFTILPNNKHYILVEDNCYNLYSKFSHTAYEKEVTEKDIPTSYGLMKHIFGDQIETGFKYLKILYENPRQILPVLALVSEERETGKTTFLNWIQMIFGENSILIAPADLTNSFNSIYATKNIIMVDETVIEKSTSVEKLKSIATAKSIAVSQKFVQQYSVPFFGKVIICTNKERDFMRIDQEEIRFWIRKINVITGKKNTNIENDLFREIPKFLKYLEQLPEIDFSKSRMVFTKEEINTSELHAVKTESKSGLCKDIEILIQDFVNNTKNGKFMATAKDIKEKWFMNNNQISISYLRKVIKDEMKVPVSKMVRYHPFNMEIDNKMAERVGQPFDFDVEIVIPDDHVENPVEMKVGSIFLPNNDTLPF